MGTAALVGGVISPLGGVLGDRIGFRPVLVGALAGGGVVLLAMPFVSSVPALAGLAVVSGAATATVSAMVFGLLAIDVPPERRSATLNLVYLPLYAAGIVGPAVGAVVVVATGLTGPFVVAAAIFIGRRDRHRGTPIARPCAGDRSGLTERLARLPPGDR